MEDLFNVPIIKSIEDLKNCYLGKRVRFEDSLKSGFYFGIETISNLPGYGLESDTQEIPVVLYKNKKEIFREEVRGLRNRVINKIDQDHKDYGKYREVILIGLETEHYT
jgi:hypothetical protein